MFLNNTQLILYMAEKLNIVHFSSEYEGKSSGSSHNPRGGLGVLLGDLAREQTKSHKVRVYLPRYIGMTASYNDGDVAMGIIKAKESRFNRGEVGTPIKDLPESYEIVMPGSYTEDVVNFVRNFDAFNNTALEVLVDHDKKPQLMLCIFMIGILAGWQRK